MPHIMKPARRIAVVGDPGNPSASNGRNPLIEAALLADSGAATPSTAP